MKVYVWPKGYADADGRQVMNAPADASDADIAAAVRKLFGSFAKVSEVARPRPAVQPVSDAYARAMSARDNS